MVSFLENVMHPHELQRTHLLEFYLIYPLYLYLFLFLVPVVIAYFVVAVMNFATLMGEVTYLFKGQLLGHLYRLYFSIFFFSILFCGLNYYQLIAPYGSQMKISAGEAYNPLAPYAIPLLLFLLGLLGNLIFWELKKN